MMKSMKALALVAALAGMPAAGNAQSVVKEKFWSSTPLGAPAAATGMALDAAGNVFQTADTAAGIALVKTTAAGAQGWTATFSPPSGYTAAFIAMGVASDGVPFVVASLGATDATLPALGVGVQRFDAATGAVLTTTTYSPAGYGWFGWVKAAPGASGDVFLVGEANNGGDDIAVARITADGAVAWSTIMNNSYYDWSPRLFVDRAGNPVVTSQAWWWNYVASAGIWTMDPRCALARLDAATGAVIFNTIYQGIPGRDRMGVYGMGVAFGANDDIYVTGGMDTTYSGQNVLEQWGYVAKFDATGALAWEWIDQSRPRGVYFGAGIVTDAAGAAFIAESVDASAAGKGLDCAVHRFDAATGHAWEVRIDGQESGDDTGCLLAADGRGGLYLAATSAFAGRGPDATVLRLAPATGATLWRAASGSALLSRPAVTPQLSYWPVLSTQFFAANAAGTLALNAPSAAGDLGVLAFAPAPAAATLVKPVAAPRAFAAGKGSRNVVVSLASSSPAVSCNVTGGGDVFNRLNVKAGGSGLFLFRPQVSATGYDATCFYEGPAGAAPVTATLSLKLEGGSNTIRIPLAFDATATHQAVANVLDTQLAGLRYATTTRVWVLDGVQSRDPDSGLLGLYRWDVTDGAGKAVATLYGKGATYTFPATKTYTVKLTVTDDDGRTGSSSLTVKP